MQKRIDDSAPRVDLFRPHLPLVGEMAEMTRAGQCRPFSSYPEPDMNHVHIYRALFDAISFSRILLDIVLPSFPIQEARPRTPRLVPYEPAVHAKASFLVKLPKKKPHWERETLKLDPRSASRLIRWERSPPVVRTPCIQESSASKMAAARCETRWFDRAQRTNPRAAMYYGTFSWGTWP